MDSSEHFAFRAGSSPLYAKGIVFTKKRLRNMMLIDTALTAALFLASKLEGFPLSPWLLCLLLMLPVLMYISRRAVLKTAEVNGQRLTYQNREYDFTELDRIMIDTAGDIALYAGNSVLLRLSVTYPNAERLLEWAANYNIPVLDHRC